MLPDQEKPSVKVPHPVFQVSNEDVVYYIVIVSTKARPLGL